MNRRAATTLTEVLVAIFIMGIGLMAILSLFPLGASQMAQALKDQRSAEAAGNAAALARVIWNQACDADPNKADPFREQISGLRKPRSIQRFVYALDDPNYSDTLPGGFPLPAGAPGAGGATAFTDMTPMPLTGPNANQSSYAVFVDMFGWQSNGISVNKEWWLAHPTSGAPLPQPTSAGNKIGLIPRRPLYARDPTNGVWITLNAFPSATQRIYKQFSLLDDLTFKDDGTPDISTGRMERQARYSWAYMFRRVHNASPPYGGTRYEADVSVVVYSGRSPDVATDETQYYAIVDSTDANLRTVRIPYASAAAKPTLKRGLWILDATVFNNSGLPDPQARFYRAVNVEDGPVTTNADSTLSGGLIPIGLPTLKVELQTNLPNPQPAVRIINVLANVVEVFQIGYVAPGRGPHNITEDQEY